jgi:hypothetical protein
MTDASPELSLLRGRTFWFVPVAGIALAVSYSSQSPAQGGPLRSSWHSGQRLYDEKVRIRVCTYRGFVRFLRRHTRAAIHTVDSWIKSGLGQLSFHSIPINRGDYLSSATISRRVKGLKKRDEATAFPSLSSSRTIGPFVTITSPLRNPSAKPHTQKTSALVRTSVRSGPSKGMNRPRNPRPLKLAGKSLRQCP